MSLIAVTDSALCITGGIAIRRTSSELKRIHLNIRPRALTWSYNNTTFFVATVDTIYSFPCSPLSSEGTPIYSAPRGQTLQPVLVCRDISTLIIAQGPSIYLLSLGTKPKLSNALIGHSTPITSLSLSNDGSFLASASVSGTLCVHNLTHNSLTVLKGLPMMSSTLKKLVCAFHSHTRTRLLVGCGKTLAIYDVMRPSSPAKTIKFSDKDINMTINSFIIAIASSPFSKPLLAIAFNSGQVALIDLEKERSLLKTLDINTPITTMSFTPDGTAIALGTESGKIIIKGWRSVEEEDQMITVDEAVRVERIVALSFQRRIKQTRLPSQSNPTLRPISNQNTPLVEFNNTAWSGRRNKSSSPTESEHPPEKMGSDRVFSPSCFSISRTHNVEDNSDISYTEVDGTKQSSKLPQCHVSDTENSAPSVVKSRSNSRTLNRVITAPPKTTSAIKAPRADLGSTLNNPGSKSDNPEFPQRIKNQSSNDSFKTNHAHNSKFTKNKIPAMAEPCPRPDSQVIYSTKPKGSSAQSCGMDETATNSDKKEKQVGWAVIEESIQSKKTSISLELSLDDEGPHEDGKPGIPTEISSTRSSEDMMRGIIMDTMYEYRRELREDIKGLHLDFIKLGRTWKGELRSLMDEHTRELKALVEENARLRKENDGLRRRP